MSAMHGIMVAVSLLAVSVTAVFWAHNIRLLKRRAAGREGDWVHRYATQLLYNHNITA